MADEDETFESTDAGSSTTYPMEAGQIRKGGYLMIKGRPTKVSDVSTSKTGKHGHAKCHFVCIDIFTGKKMEDLIPAGHTASVPFVKKMEYQCIGVEEEYLTLLNNDGETREDIKLPSEISQPPPGADQLTAQIKKMLEDEKDFSVIVLCACDTELVVDTKVMTN